jgi:hypothetical protein
MENTIKRAIYMDHYTAIIFDFNNDSTSILKTISSEMNHFVKEEILQKGESHWHNKEQDLQLAFYKRIIDEVELCDELFLFGPTTAKTELLHLIQKQAKFDALKITTKDIDNITENQKIELVNTTFNTT